MCATSSSDCDVTFEDEYQRARLEEDACGSDGRQTRTTEGR